MTSSTNKPPFKDRIDFIMKNDSTSENFTRRMFFFAKWWNVQFSVASSFRLSSLPCPERMKWQIIFTNHKFLVLRSFRIHFFPCLKWQWKRILKDKRLHGWRPKAELKLKALRLCDLKLLRLKLVLPFSVVGKGSDHTRVMNFSS